MRVSIVIPAYNAAATLGACIEACLGQAHPDKEIIVVDDGSTDDTARIAQQYPIAYVRQPNRGPAAARNTGAGLAEGDVIAFTDADCVPRPDWIEQLLACLGKDAAGVGGTYDIANPHSLLARLVHEEIRVRHAQLGATVDFLGSFNVAYRMEAFQATGGFDEHFRMASAEDNDLAYRLRDAGYTLRFTRNAVVAHHHPARLTSYLRTQMWHGYWRVLLYRKHRQRVRKGDAYAAGVELYAPAVALLLLVATPPAIAARLSLGIGVFDAGCGILWCALAAVHMPMAWRMKTGSGRFAMLLHAALATARDVARGIGLVMGIWRFLIAGAKGH